MIKYIKKEVSKMKQKKNKSCKVLASLIKDIAILSADSRCSFFYHQPKMPESIQKQRK